MWGRIISFDDSKLLRERERETNSLSWKFKDGIIICYNLAGATDEAAIGRSYSLTANNVNETDKKEGSKQHVRLR